MEDSKKKKGLNMKAQHTPTPWIVDKRVGVTILAPKHINAIGLSWEPEVASCHLGIVLEWDEQEANAEFIVRAVNAHEALVAALWESIQVISEIANEQGGVFPIINQALTVLAKAKGEK